MRRPFARTPFRAPVLLAAAALLPLASPAPSVADSVVIGGRSVRVADSPWMVALSSRDRFGVPDPVSSAGVSWSGGRPS